MVLEGYLGSKSKAFKTLTNKNLERSERLITETGPTIASSEGTSLPSLPLASLEPISGPMSSSYPLASTEVFGGPVSLPSLSLEAIGGPVSSSYPLASLEAIGRPVSSS